MVDFSYYFIEYKDGKILNVIRKNDSLFPDTHTETDSKFEPVTKNEYDLLKSVNGDIDWAKEIVEGIISLLNK
jgi:hypothetical protein